MHMKQSDLLLGTSMDFVQKIMEVSRMVSHEKGEVLFRENDPVNFFYILLNGRVKLSVGEGNRMVYDICKNGEAFGWSSLIGRETYSASAQCVEQTKLLATDCKKITKILEDDPANGIIFFKHLAATLGSRLLELYKQVSASSE